jgi:HEPN domain-containing protein
MKKLTLEWVQKAEADYRAAEGLLSLASPDPDPVCYHCWQCAEKYLKAYLTEGDIKFPRTHDLLELQALGLGRDTDFEVLTKDLYLITDYSVDVRYPGRTPTLDEAQAARTSLLRVRVFMRRKLGFDTASP